MELGKKNNFLRNYMVEDGDIIFFKFNAGAGLTTGKKK
jgi:obg-like ATPase 1